jgi:diacylglycerol kinase (ATP)
MEPVHRSEPAPSAPGAKEPFSVRARAGSFVYAFRGIWTLFRREHNAWIHLAATFAVAAAGWWFTISRLEWALTIFAIGSVLAAEAFNTAIETLADAAVPERNPLVGRAKDLAAAGVLLASLAAALIGLLVFGPRLWLLLAGPWK